MCRRPEVVSVVLDMNGSIGYLVKLQELYPDLGLKVKVRARTWGVWGGAGFGIMGEGGGQNFGVWVSSWAGRGEGEGASDC